VLVLTRRANQSIMIGHEIVVTVLEVRGDQVRLGIKAPRSIDVHREEIFVQLQQANRDAVPQSNDALETLVDLSPSDDEEDEQAPANTQTRAEQPR
jgi:carbon storage regulator